MLIKTKSTNETKAYGKRLAQKVKNGGVVCLYGDLGAGKTTLVQGLAQGLGIKKRIISPTFIIARKYLPGGRQAITFWHLDLYRLNSLEEAEGVGISEIVSDPTNIVMIEWPEKISKVLPAHYIEVKIEVINDQERKIYETVH